ncbi:MAG: leucine-rich repeat domain-containing protein, partial [Clostridia bacterium]|nr:leucine-rich repeat domain-containing protein [Clostridia bacterium]
MLQYREFVTIPDCVTSIGDYAFCGCRSLKNITIPNSVSIIGKRAFADCTSLTNIKVPNNTTSIGDSAFNSCTSLTRVDLPNSIKSIGNSTFNNCPIKKVMYRGTEEEWAVIASNLPADVDVIYHTQHNWDDGT